MAVRPRAVRVLNAVAALIAAIIVVYVAAFGAGPLPPLGSTLNPGTGVWTIATDAQLPHNASLHLPGLKHGVTVVFEANGTAHISAADDADLFFSIGYLHARFRLVQMDLLRRQGEGLLSEVLGAQALDSDRFQVMLGLDRTAKAEWAAIPSSSPIALALRAYAQGVNTRISEEEHAGDLPYMFKLLNYQPRPWTPIDSLVVKGDMTQTLDFSTTPLDYALLVRYLGYDHTMQWFPVLPPDLQSPYAKGPYKGGAYTPLPSQQVISDSELSAVEALKTQFALLPYSATHHVSNSNNWVVDGTKTRSGKPLMAGDPHLHQTLPAVWYQLEASSPDLYFSGVTIPGVPLALIGHNRHISWSLTNVQNQATYFYREKTDQAHPGQYYWRGAWRQMKKFSYSIPVKGSPNVPVDVYITVHGPVMPQTSLPNATISVDWMGSIVSRESESILDITQSADFAHFRAALRLWVAPSQNFVYADDSGNIGMISAGYYPIIKSGVPWLPLPGTGESDIIGTIPFEAIPQIYDPPTHMIASANQRPVGNDYPYYIGTTQNFFDNGYRANEIYAALRNNNQLTAQDMERIQNDTHDYLAGLIVPKLLTVLQQHTLDAQGQQARALLQSWNGDMAVDSAAASIWWTFWSRYLLDTFQPWWQAAHVPATQFPSLAINADQSPLDENLETWTLHDPTNATFSLPNGSRQAATDVMLKAFNETLALLSKSNGANPRHWLWGNLHARAFDSLIGVNALSYGPRPASGDAWTIDAADGSVASYGPSWRIVMDWGSHTGVGVFPGGQDENPLSPWYQNEVTAWWDGRYYSLLDSAAAQSQSGSVTWTFMP